MDSSFTIILDGDPVSEVPDGYRKVIKNKREGYFPRSNTVNTVEAFISNRDEVFDYCGFCNMFGRDGWKIALTEYHQIEQNDRKRLLILTHFTRTVISRYTPRDNKAQIESAKDEVEIEPVTSE